MSGRVSATAAVSAVVALPHGLLDSLVFGLLVALIVFRRTKDDLARAVAAWKAALVATRGSGVFLL
jgi:hypothetical protein